MDMPKSLESMKSKVAKQLEKVNLENILGAIGLRLIERGGRGMTLPVLAGFGAGLAVGTGVGLLFAPMTGRDLRQKIGAMLSSSSKATRDADVQSPSDEPTKPARSLVTSPANHAKSGRPSEANTTS